MEYFPYHNNQLYIEQVALADIAKQFGTPCYVYSQRMIENNWQQFDDAFASIPHQICYAVKANSNLAILTLLARKKSGFDIVSQGELERVIAAGCDPKKIVFSGVGKQAAEMRRALSLGIQCFNIESETEITKINDIAKELNVIAPVALRINPNIDAKTHHYIATGLKENKFGIAYEAALSLIKQILTLPHLKFIGFGCHIGSQLTTLEPFVAAVDKILNFAELLSAHHIPFSHINIGGGLGVRYRDETPPSIQDYADTLLAKLKKYPCTVFMEPGRAIIANAGILLTRVDYIKTTDHKNFAIVDAAMNDLLRPALYEAWHQIVPVVRHETASVKKYDIVGSVCESGDFLGKQRELAIHEDDLLAIHSAGAYGFSMSSNYNSRPRPAEVLVQGDQVKLIRRRETFADLYAQEIFKK